jgi:hypothetical protein
MAKKPSLAALIDFECIEPDCGATIRFDLMSLEKNDRQVTCPDCHRPYRFDKGFVTKLEKLRQLVLAVREAEEIIGDCNIGVATPAGEVRLPYRLLLTRLNTLVSLKAFDRVIDFTFRVEPLNEATFR